MLRKCSRNGELSTAETSVVLPMEDYSASGKITATETIATTTTITSETGAASASHISSTTLPALNKFGDSVYATTKTSDNSIKLSDDVSGVIEKSGTASCVTEKSGVSHVLINCSENGLPPDVHGCDNHDSGPLQKTGTAWNYANGKTGSKQDDVEMRGSSGVIYLEVKTEFNMTSAADNLANDDNFVCHF